MSPPIACHVSRKAFMTLHSMEPTGPARFLPRTISPSEDVNSRQLAIGGLQLQIRPGHASERGRESGGQIRG
jgi:hypothetical protein